MEPGCNTCDHDCSTNEDGDCTGRMSDLERIAFNNALVTEFLYNQAQPQQPYGQPQEIPYSRIPEALKHHVTRSGR
jgi:hypothetical protein